MSEKFNLEQFYPTKKPLVNKLEKQNKDDKIMIRVDSDLKTILEDICKDNHISVADFAREAIIDKIIKHIDIDKIIKTKSTLEEQYVELLKTFRNKENEDFFDKTSIYTEIDKIQGDLNRYNMILKWYTEYVLQK